jgi:hypothetical protein
MMNDNGIRRPKSGKNEVQNLEKNLCVGFNAGS